MAENKVVYGLKNCHYAVITEDEEGNHTYGTVLPINGATEITVDPKGSTSDFYADDTLYYTTVSNAGYEATLVVGNIPKEFRTGVLGETLEATDLVLTESTFQKNKKIAFMFEFDGDIKGVRHILYNVTVTRPSLSSATKTETAEPKPQELKMVAAARPIDGIVKRSTTSETPALVYDAWYSNVYSPTVV